MSPRATKPKSAASAKLGKVDLSAAAAVARASSALAAIDAVAKALLASRPKAGAGPKGKPQRRK